MVPTEIFISHVVEEAPIARLLKRWIESILPAGPYVFVSSDQRDIPVGSRWFHLIDNAMASAKIFIVICSPVSLQRPWINFETGCAWIKRVPVLPLCHSGQTKSKLPRPMSEFQALDMESEDFIQNLVNSLATHLCILKFHEPDWGEMRVELDNVLKNIDQVADGSGDHRTRKTETDREQEAIAEITIKDNERNAFEFGCLSISHMILEDGEKRGETSEEMVNAARIKTLNRLKYLAEPTEMSTISESTSASEILDIGNAILHTRYVGRVENAGILGFLSQLLELPTPDESFLSLLPLLKQDQERIWTKSTVLLPNDNRVRKAAQSLFNYCIKGEFPPKQKANKIVVDLQSYYRPYLKR